MKVQKRAVEVRKTAVADPKLLVAVDPCNLYAYSVRLCPMHSRGEGEGFRRTSDACISSARVKHRSERVRLTYVTSISAISDLWRVVISRWVPTAKSIRLRCSMPQARTSRCQNGYRSGAS